MPSGTAVLYGVRELVDGMRAVRRNTILMAQDIPESAYRFRATPETRSVAETLAHIAWLWTSDVAIHETHRIETVGGFDFVALMATSTPEEKRPRTKAELLELLRVEGDRAVAWIEGLSDDFLAERVALPGDASISRFEWLLATKEHEQQHRAQLTVLCRMIGVAPRFTGLF